MGPPMAGGGQLMQGPQVGGVLVSTAVGASEPTNFRNLATYCLDLCLRSTP